MRILFLSPTGTLGGAERVLLSVLSELRGVAAAQLLALADGPLLNAAAGLGVPVEALPLPPELSRLGDSQLRDESRVRRWASLARQVLRATPAAWRFVRRLTERIQAAQVDLIHSNGLKTHLLARLAAHRVPVVWHVHDFYLARPLVRRLLKWMRRGVVGAVAISNAVAKDLAGGAPDLPVCVIHNTVDVDVFSPSDVDASWLDAAAGLPPASGRVVRIGLAATYARWKGQDLFLQAVARLKRSPLPVPIRCYVIGGPIYQTDGSQFTEAELRGLARTLGLDLKIGFVGFQEDVARVYRSLDVVVHASTRPEPFGLTIAEAMACGRAVIVAEAGGAAELFRSGMDAVGFPPNDAAALADAMCELASDPDRRRRLGAEARKTAQQRFGRDRLRRQILAAYESFLKKPSRSALRINRSFATRALGGVSECRETIICNLEKNKGL
jgi:glycosyltransferase involved in cell wall biosynthesis